ncbi:hypothetical protein [Streptomyces sp. NPDC048142]
MGEQGERPRAPQAVERAGKRSASPAQSLIKEVEELPGSPRVKIVNV